MPSQLPRTSLHVVITNAITQCTADVMWVCVCSHGAHSIMDDLCH